jgi:Cu/Ag efflux protein CusF
MLFKKLTTGALIITAITACSDNTGTIEIAGEKQVSESVAVPATAPTMAPVNEEKMALYTSKSMEVTSQVEAIDYQSRIVTLMDEDGQTVTFTASDDARNLDQVAVGDTVYAEYIQSISLHLVAAEGVEPAEAVVAVAARSEEGEMPGLAAVETIVEVSTVEEINIENNTFKLKDANGVITEHVARDPENLKKSAVGDALVVTYTKAMAISVEKASAE